MVQPETVETQLLSALAEFELTPETDFELKRLEKQSRDLLSSNAARGYMCLGIIAAHRQDKVKTVELFEKALQLEGSFVVFSNYGMAMKMLAEYPAAAEQFNKALKLPQNEAQRVQGGKHCLEQDLAVSYILSGNILAASDLIEEHEIVPVLDEGSENVFHLLELAPFMKERGISDSDIAPIFLSLNELCNHNHEGILDLVSSTNVKSFSSMPDSTFIQVAVSDAPERVSDLQFSFINFLAEKEYSSRMMDHIKVSFEVA